MRRDCLKISLTAKIDKGRVGNHHAAQGGDTPCQVRWADGAVFDAVPVARPRRDLLRVLESITGRLHGCLFNSMDGYLQARFMDGQHKPV